MDAANPSPGQWDELRQMLKDRWGRLTDEDLRAFEGNMELLVSVIQQKTGEGRDNIGRVLKDVFEQGVRQVERAVEASKECTADTAESVQQTYDRVAENVRTGYHEAEGVVRQRPVESVAIAFGAGILTGLIVALLTRNR